MILSSSCNRSVG